MYGKEETFDALWEHALRALRSGEYTPIGGALASGGDMRCCLGVIAEKCFGSVFRVVNGQYEGVIDESGEIVTSDGVAFEDQYGQISYLKTDTAKLMDLDLYVDLDEGQKVARYINDRKGESMGENPFIRMLVTDVSRQNALAKVNDVFGDFDLVADLVEHMGWNKVNEQKGRREKEGWE